MRPDTIRRFRHELRKLERIMGAYLKRDTCCHGVSIAQCHALLAVEQLGQASMNEIADFIGLDKSTLSRTVDNLVKGKLLARKTGREDRRTTLISLTAHGNMICEQINSTNDERFGKILSAQSRNPDEVVEIFTNLVTAMAQFENFDNYCTNPIGKEDK